MKTTQHQLVLQAVSDGEWLDIETFACDNRYSPTKEQREQINALKYELLESRVVKRRIVINEEIK